MLTAPPGTDHADDEDCADCGAILEELENIDDEADMYGE